MLAGLELHAPHASGTGPPFGGLVKHVTYSNPLLVVHRDEIESLVLQPTVERV